MEIDETLEETYDFENAVKIDKYALDDEWKSQPSNVFKFAKLAAILESKVDDFKRKIELRRATVDSNVRQNPKDFGIDKVTEGAILNVVQLDIEYIQLNEEFLKYKKKYAIVQAAVKAMEHKRTALENEVKLYLNQYYVEPRIPEEAKDVVGSRTSEAITEGIRNNERVSRMRERIGKE